MKTRRRPGYVSLERALSKLGLASRTQARHLILGDQVRVNGVLRKDPKFQVFPEKAKIEIGGQHRSKAERRILMLNKPKGVITTHSDEKGRPTVFSLLKAEADLHLISVGRLDFATTGLLLLTNDTRLAAWLTDPQTGIRRTYLVTVRKEVLPSTLARLLAGICDRGEHLNPEDVIIRKASGRETHLTVTLCEGRNREIRRMFSACGHEVTALKRVAYGALELGELKPGEYREILLPEMLRAFPGVPV